MNKTLVCYFSASGITKSIALRIASLKDADLFEIEPTQKYTPADLDWTDKESRSTIEMQNKTFRPPIKYKVANLNDYKTVIIGFPVWWNIAPTIINTFIEENDLADKNIYIFVTSGESSYDGSLKDLRESYPHLNFINGKRLEPTSDDNEIVNWLQ